MTIEFFEIHMDEFESIEAYLCSEEYQREFSAWVDAMEATEAE